MLIDTHTHLFAEEFDPDRDEVVKRAIENGVERMYLPNIDTGTIAPMLSLKKRFPENIFCMMGLHPCSVGKSFGQDLKVIEHWLSKGLFSAVGETGIDLYWDKTFTNQQKESFSFHADLAIRYNLPLIIHTRESFDEVFEIVSLKNNGSLRGIFHCFSGTAEQAEKILSLGGFYLGIGGVITFKNSGLSESIKNVPLEKIVLETDSPYLAPVPFRGKRNESSYLNIVAEKLADVKQVSFDKVSEVTTRNALTLFEN